MFRMAFQTGLLPIHNLLVKGTDLGRGVCLKSFTGMTEKTLGIRRSFERLMAAPAVCDVSMRTTEMPWCP